jgi:hypothetical protein
MLVYISYEICDGVCVKIVDKQYHIYYSAILSFSDYKIFQKIMNSKTYALLNLREEKWETVCQLKINNDIFCRIGFTSLSSELDQIV